VLEDVTGTVMTRKLTSEFPSGRVYQKGNTVPSWKKVEERRFTPLNLRNLD